MQGYNAVISFREAQHLIFVWQMYLDYVEDEPFNPANKLSGKVRKHWNETLYHGLRIFILAVEQEAYHGDKIKAGTAGEAAGIQLSLFTPPDHDRPGDRSADGA